MSAAPSVEAPRGADLVRGFLESSPFAAHLGIRLASLTTDRAELELPFAQSLVTVGDVVHGGAISALIDTVATAAAWATDELPENARGTTVSLTVTFVGAARATDLTAIAQVVGRGRNLCYCEVDVRGADGTTVARGLVTYKLG